MRDLAEEAKKRIVLLLICVFGLSYLMSRELLVSLFSYDAYPQPFRSLLLEFHAKCSIRLYELLFVERSEFLRRCIGTVSRI